MTKEIVSYWDGNHPLAKDYQRMWDQYVPARGEADTPHGEAIRCAGRLQHEYFNNGNYNAVEYERETCATCDGDGYVIEDWEAEEEVSQICCECDGTGHYSQVLVLDSYYEEMINHLRDVLPLHHPLIDEVVKLVIDPQLNYNYTYTQVEANVYNRLTTQVVKWVKEVETNNQNK